MLTLTTLKMMFEVGGLEARVHEAERARDELAHLMNRWMLRQANHDPESALLSEIRSALGNARAHQLARIASLKAELSLRAGRLARMVALEADNTPQHQASSE